MGKKAKKNKKKIEDFKKVKLKVGRKLPKQLNLTNASFTHKSLIIRNQMVDEEDQQLRDQRNRSVSDLISRLSHPTASTREDSLRCLEQLLQSHTSQQLKVENSLLFKKISPLLSDEVRGVRRACQSLLKYLITKISLQISAHYPIIRVHLCLSLTHHMEQVQLTSLEFVSFLVETVPDVVSKSSPDKLLEIMAQIVGVKSHSGFMTLAVSLNSPDMLNLRLSVLSVICSLTKLQFKCLSKKNSATCQVESNMPLACLTIVNVFHKISSNVQVSTVTENLCKQYSILFTLLPDIWVENAQNLSDPKSSTKCHVNLHKCQLAIATTIRQMAAYLIYSNNIEVLQTSMPFCMKLLHSFPYSTARRGIRIEEGASINKELYSLTAQCAKCFEITFDVLNIFYQQIFKISDYTNDVGEFLNVLIEFYAKQFSLDDIYQKIINQVDFNTSTSLNKRIIRIVLTLCIEKEIGNLNIGQLHEFLNRLFSQDISIYKDVIETMLETTIERNPTSIVEWITLNWEKFLIACSPCLFEASIKFAIILPKNIVFDDNSLGCLFNLILKGIINSKQITYMIDLLTVTDVEGLSAVNLKRFILSIILFRGDEDCEILECAGCIWNIVNDPISSNRDDVISLTRFCSLALRRLKLCIPSKLKDDVLFLSSKLESLKLRPRSLLGLYTFLDFFSQLGERFVDETIYKLKALCLYHILLLETNGFITSNFFPTDNWNASFTTYDSLLKILMSNCSSNLNITKCLETLLRNRIAIEHLCKFKANVEELINQLCLDKAWTSNFRLELSFLGIEVLD